MSDCDGSCVTNALNMTHSCTVCPFIVRSSYGTHLLDHLAADGAGLAGGDIAVIAVLEIYADLVCSFHFELLHCLACSRDNKMIAGIVRHSFYISFSVLGTVS